MTAPTIPWIERSPDALTRMRYQAQAILFGGGILLAIMALVGGVPLFIGVDPAAKVVFPLTVFGPVVVGLGALAVVGPLAYSGRLPMGALTITAIAVLFGAIPAAVVNYAILDYFQFDPYVFGIFLLLIGPALGAPVLLLAGIVVSAPYAVGRLLLRSAIYLFLGFIVVALILVPWAHKLLFEYVDRLIQNPAVNTAATTWFEGPLTAGELVTQFSDRWRFIAYVLWPLQFAVIRDFLGLGAILGFINIIPLFGIWWERKVAGRMQSRLGPMRVGGWHGWAQSFADGIKLIFKEDFVPPQGDPALFRLAPYLAFVPAVCAFVALPFATFWTFRTLDVALVFILAMLGIEVIGVIVAGWASNNKWAVYGSMREACQMVSYEIPMGMALLIPVMTAGTLNLVQIVDQSQAGGFANWLIFHNPFTFLAAAVYYIASLASCKRAPFDLPESESELVAGFHTEYSGFRWSLFFFAEYAAMYVVCALATTLFLGGWLSPLPDSWAPQGDSLAARAVKGLMFNGPIWFVLKSGLLFYVQLWIRWTLPRIRIDQVLYSCIQVLLPFTMILVLGNTFWLLLEQAGYGWFKALGIGINVVLALIGAAALAGCVYFILHGWMNRRRLVGTLVIEHLPGA